MAGLRADKLSGDAQAISRAAQAATEDAGGVEFAADLRSGDGLVAIGQHGGSRKNLQLLDLRELGDDVFGHTIAEVFVVFAVAEIFKIEDRDGLVRNDCSGLVGGS